MACEAGVRVRDLHSDGAMLAPGSARAVVEQLLRALATVLQGQAGVRLRNVPYLREHLDAGGAIGRIAADVLGRECRPVRALLFDKCAGTNWALGWHQDRTIAVAERRDVPGYGPWTVKRGTPHVEPPITMLERMVTLRVHLDPVFLRPTRPC